MAGSLSSAAAGDGRRGQPARHKGDDDGVSLEQPLVLAWCALVLLLAGSVKGTLGIGMPLIAVPMMSLLVPVPVAVALLPLPILIANIWQAFHGGWFWPSVRRFWPLIVCMFAGVMLGARLLASLDRSLLYLVIGIGVIAASRRASGWGHAASAPPARWPASSPARWAASPPCTGRC